LRDTVLFRGTDRGVRWGKAQCTSKHEIILRGMKSATQTIAGLKIIVEDIDAANAIKKTPRKNQGVFD
jgi:hypothetical protein